MLLSSKMTSRPRVRRAHPRAELIYLPIILVMALVCRLYPINRGLGQDELFSAVNFVEPNSIWRTIFYNDAFNNHIGYSLMARVSEGLFGHSEWALRLPALLLGMASIYLFFLFSRCIVGRPVAIVATFLLALSPAHVVWSAQARGYSAMIFCTLLSSYLYLRLLRAPTRRDTVVFVAVSVFGIYVHLYAAFVTLAQILFWLRRPVYRYTVEQPDRAAGKTPSSMLRRAFVAVVGLSLLCYLPLSLQMLRDLGTEGHGAFNLALPWIVLQQLTGSEWPPIEWPPLVVPVMIVAAWGFVSLLRSWPMEARYFAWLLAGPLALVWLAHPLYLYARFFAYWLPYYILFFAAGLHSLWRLAGTSTAGPRRYVAPALAAAIAAVVVYNWTTNWPQYVPDEGYRAVSMALLRGAGKSDTFCAIGGARTVWQYYIRRPIAHPASVAALQGLSREHGTVRCAYYDASWQDAAQTVIAQFLFHHATWSSRQGLAWFVYRR